MHNDSLSEIRMDLFGRRVLTTTPPKVLDEKSIAEILNDIIPLHLENSQEIDYLHWFYKGNQPVINREKTVRAEIKNIVVENRAFEIVEFKKGYEFSHPIQYTNAGKNESAPIDVLNTYARIEGKEAKDLSLVEWMYKSGNSYRICLPRLNVTEDDAPYLTDSLDPRSTFVVYSNAVGREALFAGTHVHQTIDDKEQWVVGVYTAAMYYEWILTKELSKSSDFTLTKATSQRNTSGLIPIVEYVLNESRIGYVELCIHLFNAINSIGSNRIDAIEQFVQALLVFINCELPTDPVTKQKIAPRSGDAVDIKSVSGSPADVKYLVAQLDQGHAQITKDDLLNAAYEICGVPDRNNRSNGGGDTGQAVVLRDGWGAAESRAKSTEKLFKKSEYEYLKIVLKICRDTRSAALEIGDLTLKDIDIKFTRNRSDNMQVKATVLKLLLDANVNPEDAYEYSEMFSDPVAVWLKSKAYQDSLPTNTVPIPAIAASEAVQEIAQNSNGGIEK